jgi:hypothetical protein
MKRKPSILLGMVCSVLFAAGLMSLLAACAFDVINVKQLPAHLQSGITQRKGFRLVRETIARPRGGFRRTLEQGTNWI